jgi:hypothetical protein
MSLPASLLASLEAHTCFSGTFGYSDTVQLVLDATQIPEVSYTLQCKDCLLWHAGVLQRILPPGTDGYKLAREAVAHVAAQRGYDASIGGYHGAPASFWLSAVFMSSIDAFLVDGHRSRSAGSDLDLLMLSFKHNMWKPADPGMTDPARYTVQTVHVSMADAVAQPTSVAAFLASKSVHQQATAKTQTVTLAIYQRPTVAPTVVPASVTALTPTATTATTVPVTARGEGELCPVCKHVVQWRTLFSSEYLGCLC